MRINILVFAIAGLAIAAGSYAVGRLQTAPGPAPSAAAPASTPASAPAPTANPHAVGAASAPLPVGHAKHFQIGNSNIKAMLADGEIMWIGSSRGVVRYDTASGQHVTFDNRRGLLSNGVFYLGKIGSELWVGTYGGGLSVLNPATATWRNYNVPNGMGDAFVYHALRTRNGDVWIATWSGANRVRGGDMDNIRSWDLYTVENTGGGLPNDWVYRLAEGKNGEIWLATEGGLARFVDGQWTRWDHKDGLGAPYDLVKADIPFRNDPGEASSHHALQKQEQGLGDVDIAYNPNYIVSLVVADDGRVWAGTWGAGLSIFDGKTWRTLTQRDGLPANHVFMLEKDRNGVIWIGTSAGLARFDNGRFVRYGSEHGLFSDNVFSIAFADNGDTWVGSFGGLAQFPGGLPQNVAGRP